jgi:hypothetical protein
MKRLYIALLGSLVLSGSILCLSTLAEPADDWQTLFNGRDLAGWKPVHDVTFEVVDGHLRLVKGMGWLRSEKEFKDFILELEWRALDQQYDSGIFLRAGLEGKPWPAGGWQVNIRYNMLGALVKGYRTVVPAETPRKPVNQWVKFRIEARGAKVKLIVDGEEAWETDEVDSERGFIGIQAEDKAFEFRNIRIKGL